MITASYSSTVRLNEQANNDLQYLVERTGMSKSKVLVTLITRAAAKARAKEREANNASNATQGEQASA